MPDSEVFNSTLPAATDSGASTSAETAPAAPSEPNQPAATTGERDTPFADVDVWSDFGKNEKPNEETTEEIPENADAPPDDVEQPTTDAAPDEEDAVLEDAFKDDAAASDELTDEQIKTLRPAARAAARRNEKRAEIVKDFQYTNKPIEEVLNRFEELNPSRYLELRQFAAHSLVDENPDATFQRAYFRKMQAQDPHFSAEKLPTFDEFLAKANQTTTTTTTPAPEATPSPAQMSQIAEQLTEKLGFDWRDTANDDLFDEEQLAMVQAIRVMETEVEKATGEKSASDRKLEELQKQIGEIDGAVKTEAQTKLETTMRETVSEYRAGVEAKLIPHIAKNTGLEINEDDTPEIKAFKERRMQLYTGTPYQKASGEGSFFEDFAYNHSKVAESLGEITTRIVNAQAQEARARLKGDTAEAQKFKAQAAAEKIPLMELLAEANREFKPLFITPDIELLGQLGTTLSEKINTSSQRVEIANGAASSFTPDAVEDFDTADDVWNAMPKSFAQKAQLRANG